MGKEVNEPIQKSSALKILKEESYKFLTSTTVKVVPRLTKAENWCLKTLWMLALVLGALTASYQLIR